MSTKTKLENKLYEQEIDRCVIDQANDNVAWEKPVRVRKNKSASLNIPANLASRAAFLAKLHRTKNVEEWITHIIKERVEIEETAFTNAKQYLAAK